MKKSPLQKVISFRIESKLAARLNKRAVAERLSLNQYVRNIFIEALVQQDLRDDLREIYTEVQDITVEIDGLRRDLALLLAKLLTELADWDEETAKDWILYNFSAAVPHDLVEDDVEEE